MIAIALSKQQVLDADPRAIQQINLTANLDRAGNTTMFFIIEKAKKTVFEFSLGTVNAKCKIMTQYNSLNVKLSNSQLNKLKSGIKDETEVVLRLSSNMIRDDETNFPHKLSLTNRQVSNLRKAFTNYLSTDINLSKTQLSKMIQSGGSLGKLLGPVMKNRITINKKFN